MVCQIMSTFGSNNPPPTIHMHYRKPVPLSAIPLGNITVLSNGSAAEPSTQEKDAFNSWLLDRWRTKDELLDHFVRYYEARRGQTADHLV